MGIKEWIKEKLEKRSQEKAYMNNIKEEARREAILEMKPEMVKHYKEEEMKKMKQSPMEKFFGGSGDFFSQDKLKRMLGSDNTGGMDFDKKMKEMTGNSSGNGESIDFTEKMNNLLGNNQKKSKDKDDDKTFEQRMKKMLGR